MTRTSKKQRHSASTSNALRLYRLRTKAMKEALEIDADVESDCEVDDGLSGAVLEYAVKNTRVTDT